MRLLLLILVAWTATAPVRAETRAAFLVGNADYDHAPALDNPIRDTALLARTLDDLGFAISRHENLSRDEIARELVTFLRAHEAADVTLFYFAGHGLQYEGKNYLVGSEARLASEFDVEAEALDLDRVIRQLERRSRAALVFVDACRDNPLADRFYRENFSATRALSTRGLAPLNGAYQGAMTVFAASPGQVAYDGTQGNSPFALALTRHLPTENLEVLSLMKRVIADVRTATGGEQVPVVMNDLTAEIYLRLGSGDAGAALALQQEEALFEAALEIASLRAWDIYLSRYPEGHFRDMALAARELLQADTLAEEAGVDVAELTPARITRESAAAVEAGLGLSQEDSRAVQAALNRLGYDAGPEDGVLGRRSRQALASYQLVVGLPATGVVTRGTAERLGLALARAESAEGPVVSSRDARRYDPETLATIESDKRLIAAALALKGYEFVYGFYDGRLYMAVNLWKGLPWTEAVAFAEKAGGHLVTLTSAEENRFVLDLVKHDDRFWTVSEGQNDGIVVPATAGPAIGLYQPEGAREPRGGWRWVTGEPLDYTDWIPGQPNNWDGVEHYANYQSDGHMKGNSGTPGPGWRDRAGWDDLPGGRPSLIIEIE
jgi:hypothetical protein